MVSQSRRTACIIILLSLYMIYYTPSKLHAARRFELFSRSEINTCPPVRFGGEFSFEPTYMSVVFRGEDRRWTTNADGKYWAILNTNFFGRLGELRSPFELAKVQIFTIIYTTDFSNFTLSSTATYKIVFNRIICTRF